jgi:hypothetical protein
VERCILLKRIRTLLVVLLLAIAGAGHAASQSVVLVVRADSNVVNLDSITLRKLFLGLPVLVNGRPLHPLRNRSDSQLDPIFLQQIVAMSQSAYDRQTLIGVNGQGWLRPVELWSLDSVLSAVYADPNAVTFMWERDVTHNPRVRIIRMIWDE